MHMKEAPVSSVCPGDIVFAVPAGHETETEFIPLRVTAVEQGNLLVLLTDGEVQKMGCSREEFEKSWRVVHKESIDANPKVLRIEFEYCGNPSRELREQIAKETLAVLECIENTMPSVEQEITKSLAEKMSEEIDAEVIAELDDLRIAR